MIRDCLGFVTNSWKFYVLLEMHKVMIVVYYTVFIRTVAVATNNFSLAEVRLLIKSGSHIPSLNLKSLLAMSSLAAPSSRNIHQT
jgi:hypothetical protein